MDYRVTWEIDIEEETALGAALEAHRIMLDSASIATVFTVTSSAGDSQKVFGPPMPFSGGP